MKMKRTCAVENMQKCEYSLLFLRASHNKPIHLKSLYQGRSTVKKSGWSRLKTELRCSLHWGSSIHHISDVGPQNEVIREDDGNNYLLTTRSFFRLQSIWVGRFNHLISSFKWYDIYWSQTTIKHENHGREFLDEKYMTGFRLKNWVERISGCSYWIIPSWGTGYLAHFNAHSRTVP